MFNQMQAMLNRSTAAMLSGSTDEIAQRCHYPMVIHSPVRVLAFQSATEYAETLRYMSARMRQEFNVTAITVRLRMIDVPSGGRFRAWATISHHFAANQPPRQTQVTYFCRLVADDILVEMVEMDCELLPDQPIRGQAA